MTNEPDLTQSTPRDLYNVSERAVEILQEYSEADVTTIAINHESQILVVQEYEDDTTLVVDVTLIGGEVEAQHATIDHPVLSLSNDEILEVIEDAHWEVFLID